MTLETSRSILSKFKRKLSKITPLKSFYSNLVYLRHAIREGIWRVSLPGRFNKPSQFPQSILTWKVNFPHFEDSESLINWLKENGISVMQGRCTVYVPPQENLHLLIPEIATFYPKNSGFKILKDFQRPESAQYLVNNDIAIRSKLTGTPTSQITTANYMYKLSIGPRVWDLSCWESNNNSFTVFVVQHIDGIKPTNEQCINFLENLKSLTSSSHLRITQPNWETNPDFWLPDCYGNLLFSESLGKTQYIDFQNFAIDNPTALTEETLNSSKEIFHFGNGRPKRGNKYLYQSVPGIQSVGKRNTMKRWDFLHNEIKKSGFDLKGRVIFDVGCNSGMIIYSSLLSGALWGVGWDLPQVITNTEKLLLSLGLSRFSLFGANLKDSYAIENDIPKNLTSYLDESVIFYLSVRQHIGLVPYLENKPWKVLVYEGHQGEKINDIPKLLKPLLKENTQILTSTYFADGDSDKRPFAILVKQ